ncbi:hypothetical protein PZQ55_002688 [Clostridium botulinum]|uniref:hypothetical protein n=1 Tax=Clostridium sporogenes TaxID=1509 RepID=UPI000A5C1465|nr:hypothetical protein [Clostridium sporogenes]EKO1913600.1 hypothetical protein [Clostridium botulinum]EKO2043656.1 hypothetical protein [Clostridium botulinum]MCW6079278.1 hypothetical protein [Clostridium sporogenes]UJA30884.1 hypothetical protein L0894_12255 [Clostridium sporogenes]
MTRTQLENKYKVQIFKDSCFDSGSKYWVCMNNNYYCDGWTLKEIEEKLIRDNPFKGE